MTETELLLDADRRARAYVESLSERPVFPDEASIAGLEAFACQLSEQGHPDADTLAMLDRAGSPATTASAGPRYYGFVIGGTLPVAAAAERLALAWDQCASSELNSPAADAIEKAGARLLLEALDLPRGSAVAFGTSATAGTLSCLAAARRALLARQGWNLDEQGLAGAPGLRVFVSQTVHVTVRKALRVLGFGRAQIIECKTDEFGRIDPDCLPELDSLSILCLQAGEVNTGEFDFFEPLIERAHAAGAWVHVDGAFGLWVRTSPSRRDLARGVEAADSWTTDGHKWLNTPYDGAVAICREAGALARAMNSDAEYSAASADSQKNLGLEFSRRARGVPIWATLHSLGREGVAEMVDRHCRLACRFALGLSDCGLEVVNRVVLNQVLFRGTSEAVSADIQERAARSGRLWFGTTKWNGQLALRMSISNWRTDETHIDEAIALMADLANGKLNRER